MMTEKYELARALTIQMREKQGMGEHLDVSKLVY